MSSFRNTFYLMRHGDTQSSEREILSSTFTSARRFPLTGRGVREVRKAIEQLQEKKIDVIVASPLLRTKQTAQLIGEVLGAPIFFDQRLCEVDMGVFDGKSYEEYHAFFRKAKHSFDVPIPGGESLRQVADRMRAVVDELNQRYEGRTILIISHEDPLALLDWSFRFADPKEFDKAKFLKTGEFVKLEIRNLKQ